MDAHRYKSTANNLSYTLEDIQKLLLRFHSAYPDDIIQWAYQEHGAKLVMGTGFGPSGICLIHRIHYLGLDIPIFYLDTDQLFPETYELCKQLQERFKLNIIQLKPELSLQEQASKYGDKLWEKNPDQCCYIRKVKPLQDFLSDKSAWITGIRRDQSAARKDTEIFEIDPVNEVLKVNPLAHWTADKIWDYIKLYKLPYNPLHDRGYPSIGCIPCTSPVKVGEHNRDGRWKSTSKSECGIHLPSQEFQAQLKDKSTEN